MAGEPLDIVYFDGEFLQRGLTGIRPHALAVRFGLSLFETLPTFGRCPMFIEAHCARMTESARFFGIPFPLGGDGVEKAAAALIRANGIPETARLRITLLAGPPARGADWSQPPEDSSLAMELEEFRPPSDADFNAGVHAVTSDVRRPDRFIPAMHKTGNYLPNVLDRRRAREAGCRESIALSSDGKPIEATASNLFARLGRFILTPPLSRPVLPGIARAQILSAGSLAGSEVREGEFTLEELHGAQEAFLTNSLSGPMPLLSLDGRAIGGGMPGPAAVAAAAFLAGKKSGYIASRA